MPLRQGRVGPGRAKSGDLTPDPMEAGPAHLKTGPTLALPLDSVLSSSELETLQEFIDENLCNGFIQTISSPHGAPVLFICNNNDSLQLCVDYWGLNRISKKDRYPLPLISDDDLESHWVRANKHKQCARGSSTILRLSQTHKIITMASSFYTWNEGVTTSINQTSCRQSVSLDVASFVCQWAK